MVGSDFEKLVKCGIKPVVEFDASIVAQENLFEQGMRARVVSVLDDEEDVLHIVFDFSDFAEYNKHFATPGYFDGEGKPTLYVWQTKHYPENLQEDVYVDLKSEVPFSIIEEHSLMAEFGSLPADGRLSYVGWLEREVLVARDLLAEVLADVYDEKDGAVLRPSPVIVKHVREFMAAKNLEG